MKEISNNTLLTASMVAGPLLMVLAWIQAFTRQGFDFVRHPMSLLSVGDFGWIQILNFIVAGLLIVAGALGLRRAMQGVGSTWAPRMLFVYGLALVVGGVFVPDAGLGFPPGTPIGIPESMSLHSTIHAFAPILGFLSLTVFFCIVARRHFKAGKSALAWLSLIIGIGSFILGILPNLTANFETGLFNFIPLWIAGTLAFCYASVVLAILKKEINQNVGIE